MLSVNLAQVLRCISDICFLRLDFETFNIRGPADSEETDGGVCMDTLTITVDFLE